MTKEKTNKFEFKTEVQQLLDLVIHSLYSNKDIFLRELISNSADAIDRLRFESLTNHDILEGDDKWKIKIIPDKKKKSITVSDNGSGMSREEMIENLGTIAKSGTKNFLKQLKNKKDKENLELIGQFGVGFYSSFMVSKKVEVISKKPQVDKAYKWISTGTGGFEIKEIKKDKRGTDVTVFLGKDYEKFLEEWEIRSIVKKYSDFVEHPIVMDVEREEKPKDKDGKEIEDAKPEKKIVEEELNSKKAIWNRSEKDVTEDEYNKFYKHITHDFQDPLMKIHYSAEGRIVFKALLYIPKKSPFDLYMPESNKGLQLYVKRIFIMSDCKKVIPEYLRFVKGVVDSQDLPLNVSRELLQEDQQLLTIKKSIVKKLLSELKKLKDKDREKYIEFYKEFGPVLKEGLHYDFDNHDKIKELLLFKTSKTKDDEYRSLNEYVDLMPSDQKEIYYIISQNKELAESSPHLEVFKNKGYEVLYMLDPIDEWVLARLNEYKKKPLKAVDKGDLEIDKTSSDVKKKSKEYQDLFKFIQDKLKDDLKEVRFSTRLTDSACCLVADEHAVSAQMEQMMKAMGQSIPHQKMILELNPKHQLVEIIKEKFDNNKDDSELSNYIDLLYNQALLSDGKKISNPLDFAKKMSELMVKAAKK